MSLAGGELAMPAARSNGGGPARPLLSVVLPARDEAGVIGGTLRRIAAVAPRLGGPVEVVVVSDGSTDATFDEALAELARGLSGTVVELAANVGSHAAIRCGLTHATGDCVAIMAADGQDPPEVVPAMVRALAGGAEVAWGRRCDRTADSRRARALAVGWYRLFRRLSGVEFPRAGLDFVVVSRRALEVPLSQSQRNSSLFLEIFSLGLAQAFVDYDRGPRAGGRSKWSLGRRVTLALDMVTSFSPAPIRVASVVGIAGGALGLVLGLVVLVRAAFGDVSVPGWASLMVVTSVMGGAMLVALGLLGEYAWRILDELRRRPLFIEARRERVPGGAAQGSGEP